MITYTSDFQSYIEVSRRFKNLPSSVCVGLTRSQDDDPLDEET